MKLGKDREEVNPFEDDKILDDLSDKYLAIKQMFARGMIEKPPHHKSYIEVFKESYKIELDMEEMLELWDFMENDYESWQMGRIEEETRNAEIVNNY